MSVTNILVRVNGDLERAIKIFKRKCQRSGLFRDIKAHKIFMKPSEVKRIKKHEQIARLARIEKKKLEAAQSIPKHRRNGSD